MARYNRPLSKPPSTQLPIINTGNKIKPKPKPSTSVAVFISDYSESLQHTDDVFVEDSG